MLVETVPFGAIEVAEEQIFLFKQGLPGFEKYTRFAIIEIEDTSFAYLQSVEEGELSFLITDPFIFYPEYEFDLSENAAKELDVKSLEQLTVRAIVSVQDRIESATMNLVAPIVINAENKFGKQVILTNTAYTTKHPLNKSK